MQIYKRIEIVCRNIPYGKAATYGQIALLCGKPRNARQVGYALGRGRLGISHLGYALGRGRLGEGIPAHRIVNARGILSGAASFDVYDLQKRLLEAEGVEVRDTEDGWQVDLKKDGWNHTLEDALRFREIFEEKGI